MRLVAIWNWMLPESATFEPHPRNIKTAIAATAAPESRFRCVINRRSAVVAGGAQNVRASIRATLSSVPAIGNATPTLTQGLFKVVEINHPLILSLSKDGRRWFDKLTMSGGRRTLKRP